MRKSLRPVGMSVEKNCDYIVIRGIRIMIGPGFGEANGYDTLLGNIKKRSIVL